MKRVVFYLNLIWKPALLSLGFLLSAIVLLMYKIKTLPGGFSSAEVDYYNYVSSAPWLPDSPAYLPIVWLHKLALLIHKSTLSIQVVNTSIAILVVFVIFLLIRYWLTTRVAALTAFTLITSSWFLLTSRSLLPQISIALIFVIVLLAIWSKYSKKKKIAISMLLCSLAILIYVPGTIWILFLGVLIGRKTIKIYIKYLPRWVVTTTITSCLLILTPLLLGVRNFSFISELSGVSLTGITPLLFMQNIGKLLFGMFWNSSYLISFNFGQIPLLSIILLAFFVAGLISMIKNWRLTRNRFILTGTALGILLSGFNTLSEVFVLTFSTIIIGVGIAWLLQQWLTVFPKNPVAKRTGVAIIIMAVAFSGIFNIYRYYVAWPYMDSTKNTYNQQI